MKVKSICGVILAAANPKALADFYADALNLTFEKEEHGGLATHYGVDLGAVHFGIHPSINLKKSGVGHASINVAFQVDSIDEMIENLQKLNAKQIIPPHDEGFGMTATFEDLEGNHFELVELSYQFGDD